MATFYLKYRPQTVSELDLDNVRVQINSVLKSKNIPHAFLFSGPRGLGKTSAARIIAKALNCEKPKGIEPCNKCQSCREITSGSAVDVIEIDGASNRGIDDVRTLRENVSSAPLALKKKVYVIDEVHMLTKEAFNALLKTLEEPPDHVVFILATTEPYKIPETIISRSFHIQFHRGTEIEVKRSLKRVIEGEKLEVSDEVLKKIIEKSEGSFRDSIKILEQLAFISKNIDLKVYKTVFPQANIASFLEYLSKKEIKKALEWVRKTHEDGVDWEETIRTILNRLKDDLFVKYGIGNDQISTLNESELILLIKLIVRAGKEIRYSLVATLPLEMAVMEWSEKKITNYELGMTKKDDKKKIEEKKRKVEKEEIKILAEDREKKEKGKNKQKMEETKKKERISSNSLRKLRFGLSELREKWEEILKAIKPANFSVEALLRSAQPEKVEANRVTIKVYYEFHKERLETEKCKEIIEKGFLKIFGEKPRICYILGDKKEQKVMEEKKDEELAKDVEEIFG